MIEGIDFYWENGYRVFTKHFHLNRGKCCQSGCRHCPWNYKYNKMKEHLNLEEGFVDMDGVLADFEKKLLKLIPDLPPIGHPDHQRLVDSVENVPGFYRDLEPIEGAVEGFKKLTEKYDVHILSTASWGNPSSWTDKRLWVEEHLGEHAFKKLTLSHNKGLFTGRFLIDDRIKNGVDKFKGEHIHFGTGKFLNWDSVLKHLKLK